MIVLIFLSMAVWSLSSLFVGERGPFDIFQRLRDLAGVESKTRADAIDLNAWLALHPAEDDVPDRFAFNLIGEILSCFWCTSMWVSIFVTIAYAFVSNHPWWYLVLMPFALRTGALLIDEYINGTQHQ